MCPQHPLLQSASYRQLKTAWPWKEKFRENWTPRSSPTSAIVAWRQNTAGLWVMVRTLLPHWASHCAKVVVVVLLLGIRVQSSPLNSNLVFVQMIPLLCGFTVCGIVLVFLPYISETKVPHHNKNVHGPSDQNSWVSVPEWSLRPQCRFAKGIGSQVEVISTKRGEQSSRDFI